MDLLKGKRLGEHYKLPQDQIEADRADFANALIYYIGCFMTEKEIMRRFAYTRKEMDAECKKAFNGMDFASVYTYVFADVMSEGKGIIEELAVTGNPSALKIFAEAILKLNKEEEEDKTRLTINIDV